MSYEARLAAYLTHTMPHFSAASRRRLLECDDRLVVVCSDVIRYIDFAVLCGHRNRVNQDTVYAAGRSRLKWPMSRHNQQPSLAVDLAPWHAESPHIRWDDLQSFHVLAGAMLYVARERGIELTWGGHWESFKDLPHFQVPPR